MQREIIGIDFGTTNSGIAFIEFDEPTIIENSENERVTPSVVYFKEGGDVVVGSAAKRNIIANPERTVASIKRHMGTDHTVQIGNESYPPEYVAAHIIKKLVSDAEKRIGTHITDATITVPAYFMDSQRQAVKDAGEIAGLNVHGILNEPTAAALAFGFADEGEERRILVYDFGGGTFDVSILSIGDGFYDVDATSGDNHLGGDDIDSRLEEFIVDKIREKHKIDLRNEENDNRSVLQSIREEAERVKIELSDKERAVVNLPYLSKGKQGAPIAFSYTLTRQEFNELIFDFIERTRNPMKQALNDAALHPDEIDDILMVGGTTYIPAVQEFVRDFFGKEPEHMIDPIEVVSLGAAVSTLKDGVKENDEKGGGEEISGTIRRPVEISDVTSRSIGVSIVDGTVVKIISRNTKIPVTQTKPFTNAGDYSDEVVIEVYQGEDLYPEEGGYLGEFWIDIEPKPAGESEIDVSFSIGEEFGILNVTAKDHDSGNERTVKMEAVGRLTKRAKNKWMRKMLNTYAIEVTVENVDTRDVLDYYLNPSATMYDVRQDLMKKGILSEGMNIFYDDKALDDESLVRDLNITDGSTLELR
ncbi:MAG: Chaperone protein DnaK [Candidatus Methanogaster sp.]|nr:MAG: Chaperone protein DnaK [ANME-2 cluster archaeon]